MGTLLVVIVAMFVGAFGWNKYGGDIDQIYASSKHIVTTIKKDSSNIKKDCSNTLNTITNQLEKLNKKIEKENKPITTTTTNQHPRYKNNN